MGVRHADEDLACAVSSMPVSVGCVPGTGRGSVFRACPSVVRPSSSALPRFTGAPGARHGRAVSVRRVLHAANSEVGRELLGAGCDTEGLDDGGLLGSGVVLLLPAGVLDHGSQARRGQSSAVGCRGARRIAPRECGPQWAWVTAGFTASEPQSLQGSRCCGLFKSPGEWWTVGARGCARSGRPNTRPVTYQVWCAERRSLARVTRARRRPRQDDDRFRVAAQRPSELLGCLDSRAVRGRGTHSSPRVTPNPAGLRSSARDTGPGSA